MSEDNVRFLIMRARHIQRGYAIDVFALDSQDLAARRHDGRGWGQKPDGWRQSGCRVDNVFAIVDYQEELLSSDGARDGLAGNLLATQPQAQDGRDHGRDETGIG